MKSTGNILEELGFRKDAPRETQKAFLKHLIQAANAKTLETNKKVETKKESQSAQLSFDLDQISKISESA